MMAVVESRALPDDSRYRTLHRAVREAGLLEKRPGYYVGKEIVNVAALGATVAAACWLGNSWWQLAVAVALAMVLAQLALIGHDAGHGQICRGRLGNRILGLAHGNVGAGFSFGWWLSKHNRHHSQCNRAETDPDVDSTVVAFTADQVANRPKIGRLLARAQAGFFIPLLLFEALNLHVSSVASLRRQPRSAWLEGGLLAVHAGGLLGLAAVLMSPWHALVFVAVNQAALGLYLGLVFVTNHTGMPVLEGPVGLDFVERQVMTSRDIHTGPIGGFLFGGLQFQIEHHLFPTMPRANLARAQVLVRAFCESQGIAYTERRVAGAYGDVLRYLHRVAQPAS
ncbi:MAG TPA: acyl-CoA desaturase [Acidimicrobiales bacterium]|nr:acyl-CoA desaturase [Acidimicrobiales bacterium]